MKRNFLLLLFILAKFLLNYKLINPVYDLQRDEFLHLDQANHLAWGYLSVPPFTSLVSVLIKMLGNSEFWVHFFPCLFGALTIAVVWKTIASLGGSWFALVLGATCLLFSSLLSLNLLFQPNSFEVLAWTFCCFSFIGYFQDQSPKWLYLMFVSLGLGFLNKYNIVFLFSGFFVALVISNRRKLLATKHFWLAASAGLAIVLPNVIWQFANGFPVVHHMKLLRETQLVNVSTSGFLKDQLLFFMGGVHVLVAAFAGLFFYRPFREYRVFLWSFALSIALFVCLHAKSYYAIGLYPIYLAFGAVLLEKRLQQKSGIILRGISLALPVGFFFVIHRVAFPVEEPFVLKEIIARHPDLHLARWEDGKDHDLPQDFADMLGWKELARKVDSARKSLPANETTIVLCDNYGQAGAINFYSKLPDTQAVTMNADYVNWFDLSEPIQNIILVQDASDDDKERKRERAFFEEVRSAGKIENEFAREKGTAIYVLKHAKVDVNKILQSEIDEQKAGWR